MKVENRSVEELVPYEKNPRINKDAVGKVAKSIEKFGFKVPIIISEENVIVAGHTRLKAAKQLGIENVPCVVASDLTEAELKAFRIADNKVAEYSEWDETLLEIELRELENIGFDIEEIGFSMEELDADINDEVADKDDLSGEITAGYEVIIECEDESQQEMIYNKMIEEGYRCRVLTL